MRRRDRIGRAVRVGTAGLCLSLLLVVAPASGGPYGGQDPPDRPNPCRGELAKLLRCPDLRMGAPRDLWVGRGGGQVVIHATNDIRSRGEGPLEVRGKRSGKKTMRVRQAIHTTRGGRRYFRTDARLVFYNIPGQGPYWKFASAARFEIWSLAGGKWDRRVRVGPKLNYCFRDLKRTKPSRRSPKRMVYPACSQDPSKGGRTLGTSVGWSDIYPSTYYQNWINVTGLRGCFAFVHRADPLNLLFENRENNNVGARRVRLPPGKNKVRGC